MFKRIRKAVRRIVNCVVGCLSLPVSSDPPFVNVIFSTSKLSPPLIVDIDINSQTISMEIDTGAGVTLIPHQLFLQLFPKLLMVKSNITLSSASGPINVIGEAVVSVTMSGKTCNLVLIVCSDVLLQSPLLGRTWLDALFPDWRVNLYPPIPVSSVIANNVPSIEELQSMFPRVFDSNSDSPIEGHVARLVLKPNAIPVKFRPYKPPFGLLDTVNNILDSWETSQKAVRVRQAEWASPTFPVQKKGGSYRLVVDFKKSLNPQLRVDHYPIPAPEEIFSELADSAYYVSLDLKDAYTQLKLHPESQELCVVSTHRGFYKLQRLIYGIASSAAIFQSVMEEILANIPGVIIYLDNIFIHSSALYECVQRTLVVLGRMEKHNVRLNLSKCEWFVEKLEFLGFIVSKYGRQPTPTLISAIEKVPVPQFVKQLKAFLGLVNFYCIFMPQFSTLAQPLYHLTKTDVPFDWTPACQNAFDRIKSLLTCDKVLVHFDPKLPIVVYTDASPYGIGAVLCHSVFVKSLNKTVDRPIMYASVTLSPAQSNYAQIDREGLAVVYAVSKFHRFLWGREFTLYTDCQAIQRIFHPSKSLPVRTGHRLQHWAAVLQPYNYKLVHKSSTQLAVADALSRLPSPLKIEDVQICHVKVFEAIPLTSDKIAEETAKDPILQQVYRYVHVGWPPKDKFRSHPELQVYFKVRDSLTIVNQCLLFQARVVIPPSLQAEVLTMLHEAHPGIVRSKLLARSLVWWPNLSEDITKLSANCSICATVNFKPVKNFVPWPQPTYPFERVHVDFYTKLSLQYFIIVDAYSKWIHISQMSKTTATDVIDVLTGVFACFGLPKILVSDNGPPFESNQFAAFATSYNIKLLHSPVYSPSSNGQAERCVDIAKKGIEKIILSESNNNVLDPTSSSLNELSLVNSRINKFLFNYRNTPTTTTLKSPSAMLFSYQPRTMLTQLLPSNKSVPLSSSLFREGEQVVYKPHKKAPVVSGIIVKVLGETRYLLSVQGVQQTVHHNQLSRAPQL